MGTAHFDEIETLVRSGRHRQAKSLIARLKKGGLTALVRLKCSDWYLRIGLPGEAIKIIGPELLATELKNSDIDTLKLQSRLAYMLGYFGASSSADRVARKLEPYLSKDHDFAAQYFRYLGGNATRVYDYAAAAKNYRRSLEFLDPEKDFYLYQMMRLGHADGLDGSGQSMKAIKIATDVIRLAKPEQVILKAIAHQARGEYYFNSDQLNKVKADLEISWQLFPKDVASRDYGFLAKWYGAVEFTLGNKRSAKKYLHLALKILSTDRLRPTNILEVLFWLAQLEPSKLRNKYWVVNTHPSQIPYSFLTGRKCQNARGLHPWIVSRLKRQIPADTWVLERGCLKSIEYKTVVRQSSVGTPILDLVAGIKSNRRTFSVLSELKTKCLLALVSASSLGMSDWALIDYVYEGEWQIPQSMAIRLNDLIQQLRLQGFKIRRRKNQFFWKPPARTKILLPMNHQVMGVFHHLSHLQKSFSRSDVENLYGVSVPTAKVWIREWSDAGKIKTLGRGPSTSYEFM